MLALTEARRRLLAYGLLTPDADDLAVNGVIFAHWIKRYGELTVASAPTHTPIDVSLLRRTLMDRFNSDDLRTLCFELRLHYDDLGGENRSGKIRELIPHHASPAQRPIAPGRDHPPGAG
ncbi:MAG: hypothetical protein M5U34_00390 [Chloroflexi bacterium]|nr:hypothetical protein [Chloroflexota bacterium]